jgi:hypothetical protein
MYASESITIHRHSTAEQSSDVLRVIEEQKRGFTSFSQNIEDLHLTVDSASIRNQALHSELAG